MIEALPYEHLATALGVRGGITAVMGSGGKTTTVDVLSRQLAQGHTGPHATELDATPRASALSKTPRQAGSRNACAGSSASHGVAALRARIVLTTSTHIRPFAGRPLYTGTDAAELAALLCTHGAVCCGSPDASGKLAAPALGFDELASCAAHVLVEADGSRSLPLKAHGPHEPVIPAGTRTLIVVVGANGFNRPIACAVHRPERFCALAGCNEAEPATPELVARAIAEERTQGIIPRVDGREPLVLLTHVNDAATEALAARFARAWGRSVLAVDHPTGRLRRIAPHASARP